MARKDFELIARILRSELEKAKQGKRDNLSSAGAVYSQFDADKFRKTCS